MQASLPLLPCAPPAPVPSQLTPLPQHASRPSRQALRKPWRQELVRKLAFAEACGGGGHDSAMAQAQAELADEQGGYSWLERRS